MKKQTMRIGIWSALVLVMLGMVRIASAQDAQTDLAATWEPQTKETVDGKEVYTWHAGNFDNWVDADRNPGADPSGGSVGIVGTGPERAVLNDSASVDGDLFIGMNRGRNGTTHRGAGELEMTPNGELTLANNNKTVVGYGSNAAGTVHQNGGTFTQSWEAGPMMIGQGTRGIYNLNGGTLVMYADQLHVGAAGDHNSQLNIMGGTLDATDNTNVFVGKKTNATGTFYVHGNNPGSIKVGKTKPSGGWVQGKGGTLKIGIDKGGITPIEVRNDVTFQDGATLDVRFIEDSRRIGFWDVMTIGDELTDNGLRLADSVDKNNWRFRFVDTEGDGSPDTLRVISDYRRDEWISSLENMSGSVSDRALNSLITVLDAETLDDRLAALSTLADMGPDAASLLSSEETKPVVEDLLQNDPYFEETMEALLAAGVAERAVPQLITMVKSNNSELQRRALNTLEMIGPPAAKAVQPVADLLSKKGLRRQAAETLAEFGSEAAPALVDALREAKEQHLYLSVLNAIRTAEDDLLTALAENDYAVDVISRLAQPQVGKPIRDLAHESLRGMNRVQARSSLGDLSTFENWAGLEEASGAGPDGGDAARMTSDGKATFRYGGPDRERTGDWSDWSVLAFDVKRPSGSQPVDLTVSISGVSEDKSQPVEMMVPGGDWQTVHVPLNKFREHGNVPRYAVLNAVEGVDLTTDKNVELLLAAPRLQHGRTIGLLFPEQSRSGEIGETLTYEGTVVNSSDRSRSVTMNLDRQGAAVMPTTVEPRTFELAPGESRRVTIQTKIPTPNTPGVQGKLPQGARERWTIEAVPDANLPLAETSELTHLVEVDSPYLIHTEDEWEEIRNLVESEEWAKEKAESKINWARSWEPEGANPLDAEYAYGGQKNELTNTVHAYHLTHDRALGEKLAGFLREFADPVTGFPAVGQFVGGARTIRHGNHLRAFAKAYAAIRDTDLLSAQERDDIERAFRLTMEFPSAKAPPGNQPLQSVTGGLFAALAIQDWQKVDYFLEGPGKFYWHIRRGIMDDGWWVEMSTGYNILSAKLLTKGGLALRPWGIDALTRKFSAVYHENYRAWADPGEEITARFYPDSGIFTSVWGPSRRNYRQIRDLWDATIALMNEEGRVPGLNDSGAESSISTNSLFLAAYAYDDPTYLRNTEEHNLLYPVELPDDQRSMTKLLPSSSAHNAGVDLLRSQGVETPEQQYQTLLSYGSHGGFHGHWDRLNVGWMRRFGRIIMQSPKTWYRYDTPMYQFGMAQASLSHNMLIVDGKNQYPAASHPITFHAGDLFQASAVENKTRWSNPRYGGHPSQTPKWYNEERGVIEYTIRGHDKTFTIPVPEDHPEWGHMNDYTEPVRSRRLLATTDEYVLVVDHVQAESKHMYDVVYNLPNFQGFGGSGDIELTETREKFDDSPLRTGQLISPAHFHKASGNVRGQFKPGYARSSESSDDDSPRPFIPEDGTSLSVDVHTVWPPERRQVVGDNPPITGSEGWTLYSAAREKAREASFVTMIEVQKEAADRMIQSIEATGPGRITVTLADGRTHEWRIDGLRAEQDRPSSIDIQMTERGSDGSVLNREKIK